MCRGPAVLDLAMSDPSRPRASSSSGLARVGAGVARGLGDEAPSGGELAEAFTTYRFRTWIDARMDAAAEALDNGELLAERIDDGSEKVMEMLQ